MTLHDQPEIAPEMAQRVIQRIADVARIVGIQAGVGAMETAGAFVSFLAANPTLIPSFLSGAGGVVDWPADWHRAGCLSWQGMDGRIHWPGEGEVKQ